MWLSELQHRNLLIKCCLEISNKSKSETAHLKLLKYKKPTIYRTINALRSKKVWRENWFWPKMLPSTKARTSYCFEELNNGSRVTSYRKLRLKIHVCDNTVKKYLTKMVVHCKAKKYTPKVEGNEW
jgi:hypothetical protein